jgi:hypothetical protein
MAEILSLLQKALLSNKEITFDVFNPDLYEGYAGASVLYEGETYLYRGYKSWIDLAELLKCKMRTPMIEVAPFVRLRFVALSAHSFHDNRKESEKYGLGSAFSQIYKMEEPAFYYYYQEALSNAKISERKSVLNLGINRGDELEVIKNTVERKVYEGMTFVGIDHSQTAIDYANSKFNASNELFYAYDLNDLHHLALGKFDMLISIGTLQSPSINFKPFFMHLIQEYLSNDASIILGFPNSRWLGGEVLYGAKAPHYSMSEMGLVLSDILFCKKYLQQKKYRVRITGKYYLFLTATRIGLS